MNQTAEQLRKIASEAAAKAWAAEAKERDAANRAVIGKTFKFSNSYGSGSRWWLYTRVTDVKDGNIVAFQFETDSLGEIHIKPSTIRMQISDGYLPIKKSEFDRAWKAVARKIAGL